MNKKRMGALLGAGAGLIIVSIILVLTIYKPDMMKAEQTEQGRWVVIPTGPLDTKPIKLSILDPFAWNQEMAEEWKEGLERINRRLQKLGKEYHLELEMSPGRLESPQDLYTLEEIPDIVLAYGVLIPEAEMGDVFLELTPYLESLALESISMKRTNAYWKSKAEADGIYNLSINNTDSCHAVHVNITKCREIGYEVPDVENSMELSAWEAEFEKIYQVNGNKPFICFETSRSETAEQVKGILLGCRPQGETSIYSGLDFDGQGAIFPYNKALKEILTLYQSWAEKGYLTEDWEQCLIQFRSAEQKTPYEYVEQVMTGPEPEDIEENIIAVLPIKGDLLYRRLNRSYFRAMFCGIAKEGMNHELAMEVLSLMNTDSEMQAGIQACGLLGQSVVYDDQEQIPDQVLDIGLKELSLDLAPVRQEVAAVNRVISKYEPRFRLAYYEQWLEYYDQMIEEMYENGAQIIVDEVNHQLAGE